MTDELNELRDIKKLLVLLLQANKVDQGNIAKALGVKQPAVSKMLSRKGKKDGAK
ncbi:MAG: hypothetical protein LYZ69_09545 [Nitrososphaerales archaeon]|nr:hypothetical protein [Nitrososphaerales archaeon]